MGFITIDGYPIDLAESEEHSLKSNITTHPVEDGSDVSDNIRREPRELTLNGCIVSDTPIGDIALDDSRILIDGNPPPGLDAYRKLESIWLAGEPVTIVTGLKKYDSMGLEELTIPREAKNAGGLVFTAHFKEIRIVQNKRVTMALPNTGGEQNLGLSLDHLVEGNNVLWRKGNPPGLSPATVPPGKIVGQEIVVIRQDAAGKHTKFVHQTTGKELTLDEYANFQKDMNRDMSLMTDRGLYRAMTQSANQDEAIKRANDMAQYKLDHPGAQPDPSQFGLKKGPDGHWTAS